MNITLGVYDLFTYTTPGLLYLALLTYIGGRLAWIDPVRILQANTTLVIIAAVVLSYLVGHITYGVGYFLSRVYGRGKSWEDAVKEFVERVPTAKGRPFLRGHRSVLLAAVETHEIGAAAEISRLRAIGLMLRNSAPVFVLGAMTEVTDAATDYHPIVAACCLVIFLLAAAGCLYQSVVMRHWANMKTLELAYWVPDVDNGANYGDPSKPPALGRSKRRERKRANA